MRENIVCVIDGGGRGAALVDKHTQSQLVDKVVAIPGNDLMKDAQKSVVTYPNISTTDINQITDLCKSLNPKLVEVAQDNAIALGLVDELTKQGIPTLGPSRRASQIEWDKGWARKFGDELNLPQPKYQIFKSPQDAADWLLSANDQRWVVKASGLAEGKGVVFANDNLEAIEKVALLVKRFPEATKEILLEEQLVGEEFSSFAICDGESFQLIGNAEDYKRVFNFDRGDNTGGMGCVSPPAVLTPRLQHQTENIFSRVVGGLTKKNRRYVGVLYYGGMKVRSKPKTLEFNARWGDPEAQALLPGIRNDWFEVGLKTLNGDLKSLQIENDGLFRVVVAGVTKGYPEDYSDAIGKRIYGLKEVAKRDVKLYGSGVARVDDKDYVAGGRLFYIVGSGDDVIKARRSAYEAMSLVSIEGDNLHFRTDIGLKDEQATKISY